MNCERCGRRPASVKYIEIEDGVKRSRWLCEVCAAEEGAQAPPEPSAGGAADLPVFMDAKENDDTDREPDTPCPRCGTVFEDLQGQGLLGCPECYEHFQSQLESLLLRFHRAATHVGKAPRARGVRAELRLEIAQLRARLEEAVGAEDFETAAHLRDEIAALAERLKHATGDDDGGV
ncbi:MAG: UvrB/UvrC motif-containing protein [Pseudomonadales bacterium]|nr:UvrB/UvrC motif-containing protein [Pseudomonadales bacterium]